MNDEKQKTQKTGFARLLELAGGYKNQLIAAAILSVLAAAARLAPFFTIYGVIHEVVRHIGNLGEIDAGRIYALTAATFAAALINAGGRPLCPHVARAAESRGVEFDLI
ncbi:MAG: hypothetical protein LBK56_13445 [Gracilibacteraceae bacterium]|jgi:ATP-binding cassette subfamily B protein|nr:hypothetical protein [Gracilibacteraceae bacterium]